MNTKKWITIVMCLVMVLSMAACADQVPPQSSTDPSTSQSDFTANQSDPVQTPTGELTVDSLMAYPVSPEEDFKTNRNADGEDTCSIYDYVGDDEIIVIPETINGCIVTRITGYAFSNSSPVKAVRLPDTVTTLEDSCFILNKNLEIIVFGSGMRKVGNPNDGGIFQNCTNLKTVVLNDGLEEICYFAFSGCDSLTSIEIPTSVTEIAPIAFCMMPEGFTIIGEAGSYAEQYASENGITFQHKD